MNRYYVIMTGDSYIKLPFSDLYIPKKEEKKSMKTRPDRPKFDAYIKIDDSNWISEIQYDPETLVLDAKLQNGARYRYRNVPHGSFARVVTAKSSGQAFNTYIKPLGHKKLPATR